MIIDSDNNFCRVFELPLTYPAGFCFGGGKPIQMQMVDWFNPIHPNDINKDIIWDKYKEKLRDWLINKRYIKANHTYVLITNFNEALVFNKE